MSNIRTTAAGTAYNLAPSAESVPSTAVEKVIDRAAALIGRDHDLFVSDHNHGDVRSPGAWCVAHEGDYEWPFRLTEAEFENRTLPRSLFIEPGAGWWLGVYPA